MVEKLGLSYHNIRGLHQKLDAMPERAGEWKIKHLSFTDRPDEIFTIRFRDPVEAIRSLWKDSYLSSQMVFSPAKVYSNHKKDNRIFSEMWTAKWWHVLQVSYTCTFFGNIFLCFQLEVLSTSRRHCSTYHHRN